MRHKLWTNRETLKLNVVKKLSSQQLQLRLQSLDEKEYFFFCCEWSLELYLPSHGISSLVHSQLAGELQVHADLEKS